MPRQEVHSETYSSATSLFRALGGWGNSNGPTLFMVRAFLIGSSLAPIFGITASMIGSMIWGTGGLPFIIGSSFGYVLAILGWYKSAVKRTNAAAMKFPGLMLLHLKWNYPVDERVGRLTEDDMRWEGDKGWVVNNWLISAWLTAQDTIDDIMSGGRRLWQSGILKMMLLLCMIKVIWKKLLLKAANSLRSCDSIRKHFKGNGLARYLWDLQLENKIGL